jgi:hypothetical protein
VHLGGRSPCGGRLLASYGHIATFALTSRSARRAGRAAARDR